MPHEWIVERTAHRRVPYRIRIEGGCKTVLAVKAQCAWLGAGRQTPFRSRLRCEGRGPSARWCRVPAAASPMEPLA